MIGYLSADIICSEKQTVSYEHIFAPNEDYCFFILQIFSATCAVSKIGEYSWIFTSFIRSRDVFRPIACERKYLMECTLEYFPVLDGRGGGGGEIRSREAFRLIARERKYFINYKKPSYSTLACWI